MEWEFTVLNNIQGWRNDFCDKLMPCISFLGYWAILWIVITILCLAVKRYRKLGRSLAFDIIFAATIIFIYNRKLGMLAYLIAFAIAFSRLYLYVHFPTDVILGAVFGVATAIISYKIENMFFDDSRQLKYKKSV